MKEHMEDNERTEISVMEIIIFSNIMMIAKLAISFLSNAFIGKKVKGKYWGTHETWNDRREKQDKVRGKAKETAEEPGITAEKGNPPKMMNWVSETQKKQTWL